MFEACVRVYIVQQPPQKLPGAGQTLPLDIIRLARRRSVALLRLPTLYHAFGVL